MYVSGWYLNIPLLICEFCVGHEYSYIKLMNMYDIHTCILCILNWWWFCQGHEYSCINLMNMYNFRLVSLLPLLELSALWKTWIFHRNLKIWSCQTYQTLNSHEYSAFNSWIFISIILLFSYHNCYEYANLSQNVELLTSTVISTNKDLAVNFECYRRINYVNESCGINYVNESCGQ